MILGGSFVSYWVYTRYFQKQTTVPLTYQVQRGDIREELKIRGEVAAEREYDMAFGSFGTVEKVAVTEGQSVKKGDFLMRLNTTTSSLELSRLTAERTQSQASLSSARAVRSEALASVDAATAELASLKRGALPEDINVQVAQTEAARSALTGTESALADAIRVAYTAADSAVRTTADQLFVNPRTENPSLSLLLTDDTLTNSLESQRILLEDVLTNWQTALSTKPLGTAESAAAAQTNLGKVTTFLSALALALNEAIPTTSTPLSTILIWQADVSAARASVNSAAGSVTAAETARQASAAALSVAERQLTALQTGTAAEKISAQEAVVRQAEARMSAADADIRQAEAAIAVIDANIGIAHKKIRDASLFAPAPALVTKVWFKENEQYQQTLEGVPAISLATAGVKIQSEISELDIPKIHAGNGNSVRMVFDAFPDRAYTGEIVSIEPKEVVRDSDTYYRVNIAINEPTAELRRRMSADVVIHIAEKTNVLSVPLFMVTERDGKKGVVIQNGKTLIETPVETGIANDEFVEIVSGVHDGDILVAPPT